jgi:TPP-dependent pyruvate/acetoin dehydrogenase alpha subunit
MAAEVDAELDEAVRFAQTSPDPAPEDALDHVYVEPLPAGRGPR